MPWFKAIKDTWLQKETLRYLNLRLYYAENIGANITILFFCALYMYLCILYNICADWPLDAKAAPCGQQLVVADAWKCMYAKRN